ncbi:hypothetical protein D3C80_263020 [compost metagenome]
MAEQEVACCFFRNATTNGFIHGLLHDNQKRSCNGFRKTGLENCELLNGYAMRAHHWCPDDLGDFFAQCISFFRTLHQSRNDVLLCKQTAEVVLLCLHIRFVVEDRRMARMGHEIGEICAFWQMTGKWCSCVERNNHGARLQLVYDACCNLADDGIRHSQNDDFRPFKTRINIDGIDAEVVLQACLACVADFDVAYVKARTFEVLGQTVAHLAARSEQSDSCHDCSSFPDFW